MKGIKTKKAFSPEEVKKYPHVFFRGEQVVWVKEGEGKPVCCSWNAGLGVYTNCFQISQKDFDEALEMEEKLNPLPLREGIKVVEFELLNPKKEV